MTTKENENIIHREFEDYIFSPHYYEKLKNIHTIADGIFYKKVSVQNNYLKRKMFLLQKWIFISIQKRKLLLMRYSNLF